MVGGAVSLCIAVKTGGSCKTNFIPLKKSAGMLSGTNEDGPATAGRSLEGGGEMGGGGGGGTPCSSSLLGCAQSTFSSSPGPHMLHTCRQTSCSPPALR